MKSVSETWFNDQTIYEVNIRQYTEEGTIQAFRSHLPRLKSMGVGILWMMPIHPIGEINRKEPWEVTIQLKIIMKLTLSLAP